MLLLFRLLLEFFTFTLQVYRQRFVDSNSVSFINVLLLCFWLLFGMQVCERTGGNVKVCGRFHM